jgi:Na+-transporting NADH:ubiquinone oxidoreductase subunit A
MGLHRIKKGLAVRLAGTPQQVIGEVAPPARVGLVAADYPGLRARLAVGEGDFVKRGQLLFEDRSTPGVRYTAPGAGRIEAICRGARRALRAVVVERSPAERSGRGEALAFESFRKKLPADLDASELCDLMVESGLWTAFRMRPFNSVPSPMTRPRALFVTATDSAPLAPEPSVVIRDRAEAFRVGLAALPRLSDGPTFLCTPAEVDLDIEVDAAISIERFGGPHPSGTAGLHVHRLFPAGRGRTVWTIGYQDVIALGELLASGLLPVERVVALGGSALREPRLVRTRLGASIGEILSDQLDSRDAFVVAGSVLDGRACGDPAGDFLGRYHHQVSALAEAPRNASAERPGPILPLGIFESVFPFDLLPTFLLRALAARDLELAEELGCLELVEEDLALCSYVCPAGNDYGSMLRSVLDRIHGEWREEMDEPPC